MFNIPNILSLCRLPLAFIFLKENIMLRLLALILAMISDGLDGYLARRYKIITRLGTLLDPITDKFFVLFVLSVMLNESRITLWEAAAFLCRDFSVVLFGIYLAFKGYLKTYQFRAIWCGKVTTTLQFTILLALTLQWNVPLFAYSLFIVLGLLALTELYLSPYVVLDRTLEKNRITDLS